MKEGKLKERIYLYDQRVWKYRKYLISLKKKKEEKTWPDLDNYFAMFNVYEDKIIFVNVLSLLLFVNNIVDTNVDISR